MRVFDCVHTDDLKRLGPGHAYTLCLKCRLPVAQSGQGLKYCAHDITISTIDNEQVEARITADIHKNIRRIQI
jgi:hypothetical protein